MVPDIFYDPSNEIWKKIHRNNLLCQPFRQTPSSSEFLTSYEFIDQLNLYLENKIQDCDKEII